MPDARERERERAEAVDGDAYDGNRMRGGDVDSQADAEPRDAHPPAEGAAGHVGAASESEADARARMPADARGAAAAARRGKARRDRGD